MIMPRCALRTGRACFEVGDAGSHNLSLEVPAWHGRAPGHAKVSDTALVGAQSWPHATMRQCWGRLLSRMEARQKAVLWRPAGAVTCF